MEKPLRVKLFGESFKIHKLKIDNDLMPTFIDVANKVKTKITNEKYRTFVFPFLFFVSPNMFFLGLISL